MAQESALMLAGVTFMIPAPAADPIAAKVIAEFPRVAERKIPMRCRYHADTNTWECDVLTLWERPTTWAVVGGTLAGVLAGFLLGRMGRKAR